jgi:hypothetical protein
MVHYPQMRNYEFTFPPEELYLSEYRNRIDNNNLEYGAVYIAVSKLKPVYSTHTIMTFPVLLERMEQPIENPTESPLTLSENLAATSFKLILLDKDFFPKESSTYRTHMTNGYWDAKREPLIIKESGADPIMGGYLLESLPDSYSPDDVVEGKYFPMEYGL